MMVMVIKNLSDGYFLVVSDDTFLRSPFLNSSIIPYLKNHINGNCGNDMNFKEKDKIF